MTRRRLQYVSPTPGPYHPARLRRVRGWTIVDDAGRIVWTEPHPHTGRARPAILPTYAAALAVADDLDDMSSYRGAVAAERNGARE